LAAQPLLHHEPALLNLNDITAPEAASGQPSQCSPDQHHHASQ
jgi:hypothetical protein